MSRTLGLEVFDELPASEREVGSGRESETVAIVNEVIELTGKGEIPAGKPVRIAIYDKSGGAAGCATGLKRRFGNPEANGVKFNTRKTKHEDGTTEGYSVFVMYDPSWIVPGAAEQAAAEYKEYLVKMRDKAREAAAKKAAEGNGEGSKSKGKAKAEATA